MKMYVNTSNKGTLNLRAAASSSATIIDKISYGTELDVETVNEDWSKTSYNGRTGYVMNKFLTSTANKVNKNDLQRIYDSLKSTLSTIENVLK